MTPTNTAKLRLCIAKSAQMVCVGEEGKYILNKEEERDILT